MHLPATILAFLALLTFLVTSGGFSNSCWDWIIHTDLVCLCYLHKQQQDQGHDS